MRKLVFVLGLILATLSFSEEVVLTRRNILDYYVKENGKIHRIKVSSRGGWYSLDSIPKEYSFEGFVVYLKSINATLVKKDSIKFKVEEE